MYQFEANQQSRLFRPCLHAVSVRSGGLIWNRASTLGLLGLLDCVLCMYCIVHADALCVIGHDIGGSRNLERGGKTMRAREFLTCHAHLRKGMSPVFPPLDPPLHDSKRGLWHELMTPRVLHYNYPAAAHAHGLSNRFCQSSKNY